MISHLLDMFERLISRIAYRFRQLISVLRPGIDEKLLHEARSRLPKEWRAPFDKLLPSEKAHVLRLYRRIGAEPALSDSDREELIILALTHDIGKSITRPSLFERVVKALLPIPKRSHAVVGAKILSRLGADRILVERVRRHHENAGKDGLLAMFQTYDDSA